MIRLAIRCRAEDAERVLAELLELAPGGVEEDQGAGWVEYAIYGPPGEVPALPDLEAGASGTIQVSTTEIPDDWADRWRDFHEPTIIGDGRLVVRPSWTADPHPAANPDTPGREAEEVSGSGSREVSGIGSREVSGVDVVIDPGQAFGTGAHATTHLCLELLLELADDGVADGALVDLGTGSGVLAIAAAKLGWAPVLGCDSEQAAVDAAGANAAANGVGIEFARLNVRSQPIPVARTMVANLTAPLLGDVAASIRPESAPHTLVCSGLLATEAERVEVAFARLGLQARETRFSGDWGAILFAAS